ncbi:hypothetical protein B0H13DRAFT_1589651 [Mycena leptocephala]|nr:hypothetical protein B0H13DRAFT_1589651 [Mycena leptocephala]
MFKLYAFTDYQSQGQTLPYVVVEISTPPTGHLSLFNLHVVLLRSSGRETIRALWVFDDKTFQKGLDLTLLAEGNRLEELKRILAWLARRCSWFSASARNPVLGLP